MERMERDRRVLLDRRATEQAQAVAQSVKLSQRGRARRRAEVTARLIDWQQRYDMARAVSGKSRVAAL